MAIKNGEGSCVVVGVDHAAPANGRGFAKGRLAMEGDTLKLHIEEAQAGIREYESIRLIKEWVGDDDALISIDAPLGWPQPLGQGLSSHVAGEPLTENPDTLFKRETDVVVAKKIGQKGFEVGANLIARTAHSALEFLQQLRERLGKQIPLSWTPGHVSGVAAIEAYPAATLKGRGIVNSKYKNGKGFCQNRENIVGKIENIAKVCTVAKNNIYVDHDALDAALCLVAALDFARGDVIKPENWDKAKKESWIWVRPQSCF